MRVRLVARAHHVAGVLVIALAAGCVADRATSSSPELAIGLRRPVLNVEVPPDSTVLSNPAPGTGGVLIHRDTVAVDLQNNPYNIYSNNDRIRYRVSSGIYGAGMNVGWVSARADIRYRNTPLGTTAHYDSLNCGGLMQCEVGAYRDVNCSQSYHEIALNSVHRARFYFTSSTVTESAFANAHCHPTSRDEDDATEPTIDPCDDPTTEIVETDHCAGPGGGPVTGGTSGWAPVVTSDATSGGSWVLMCDVIDWCESTNGGPWHYTGTTVNWASCSYQ